MLGKGAFSEVYRVKDDAAGAFWVCKVSSQVELAEHEAELLGKVNHPLFPKYRGRGLWQDRHYLLMEYVCGGTLGDYVRKRGSLSVGRAVEIAMELAEGLCYLHEQSETIIFRDIKPENVMVQMDGKIRLVDLGCACVAGRAEYGRAGSPGYAAPEQLAEGCSVGAESDVYGLGKLLYFMLTGKEMCGGRMEKCRHIPGGLMRLLYRATRQEPRKRIPDMRSFIQQLAVYEKGGSVPGRLKSRSLSVNGGRESAFYYEKNISKGVWAENARSSRVRAHARKNGAKKVKKVLAVLNSFDYTEHET